MTGAAYLYLLFPPVAALLFAWGASRSIKRSAAKIDAMRAEQARAGERFPSRG